MLAVGKELLIGRTMNSNAFWIGMRLALMGSMIKEIATVDDELDEIGSAFVASLARSPDFVVVVGGLGPTPDDMTLKGLAKATGLRLRRSPEALAMIKEHYASSGRGEVELTPARLKMATLPEGSVPLKNRIGTAPGVKLTFGGTRVYSLPGVPAEMKSIFRSSVEPEIRAAIGPVHRCYLRMRLEGVPESTLAPALSRELRRHPGAYIKSHPRGVKGGASVIELDVAVSGRDPGRVEREGEAIAEDMKEAVVEMGGAVGPVRGLRKEDR